MKLEAIKRQAGQPKNNLRQVGTDLRGVRSDSIIAGNSADSARTVQRYIRLTELQPELQQMVEENGRKSVSRAMSDRTSPACPFCLEDVERRFTRVGTITQRSF